MLIGSALHSVAVGTLISDLLLAAIDPRVRFGAQAQV